MKVRIYKVSRERAIEIAANHNCVSRQIAERYTDSELAESPEKALQSIKASNKEWMDCTIWIEYNPTGQRVEKIANE